MRYRPYFQVDESASTVDIDRDKSTGRLKSNRPIDDTCEFKDKFYNFGAKIQIYGAKIQIHGAKHLTQIQNK